MSNKINQFCHVGALLIAFTAPMQVAAHSVFGTVTGPDGLLAAVEVVLTPRGSGDLVTVTDQDGNYAFEIPGERVDFLIPQPTPESGLIGERTQNIDITGGREVHLFAANKITLSGDVLLPGDFEGNPQLQILRLDKLNISAGSWGLDPSNHFEATLAAGVYVLQVFPECEFSAFLNRHVCGLAKYFSSITVDATAGSLSGLVIPVADPDAPIIGNDPPVAALIQVGTADGGGIATVQGLPGSVPGPSLIRLVNLQTGQQVNGASLSDGSFELPFFAPPGSFLEVSHDPTGVSFGGARSAGTIIRVPPVGNNQLAFAVPARASQHNQQFEESNIPSLGIKDAGRVWISGEFSDRDWVSGEEITLEGALKVYSNDVPLLNPADLFVDGGILIERVFDQSGKQELARPELMSHLMTPSLLPIQRHRLNGAGSRDAISLSYVSPNDISALTQTSSQSLDANWQATFTIPDNVPAGTYSVLFEFSVQGLPQTERYFEDTFSAIFSTLFTVSHSGLVRVGSPGNNKLSWALGLNELSNGMRGSVAIEDRDRLGISGRVTTNSNTLVVPRINPKTGTPKTYRLEPFAPLTGASNRGWMTPPPVPFKFPSGSLSVSIVNPDGSITNLGEASFKQPFVQEVSGPSGGSLSPVSNAVSQYFGLTTLDPRFDVQFNQYGRHVITMTGTIEDIYGSVYAGGGTYEVFVAKHLDLETGVFPNTPFEVGDSFSPGLIVQPGVEADVEIRIDHYPESDRVQRLTKNYSGKANRYGYFYGESHDPFAFTTPGEYRVEYRATYTNDEGEVWIGSETWGSVVETPNSPLITRGKRGHDAVSGVTQPQWFNIADIESPLHFFPPFAGGDVLWMLDLEIDPHFAAAVPALSIQDTFGEFSTIVRDRNEIMENFDSQLLELAISVGEIPIFSSTATGLPPALQIDAIDTHRAYLYGGVARPGVRVRNMISEDNTSNAYWRFDDSYNYQPGNGINGDLPNDFKFQFGGAVYRAPDIDFYYYGAYGSLWVLLPNDDSTGGRLFPPFQGNGGGPSGGPIMTLKGEDIDIFFHPTGTRPGSILEVGDVVSLSGQIGPTLPSQVEISVTSPRAQETKINGTANKVGYFYESSTDFRVYEAGVWTVNVNVWHDGQTSAGLTTEPFPSGNVLGSNAGEFKFYVVEKGSFALQATGPGPVWVEPGKGIVPITITPPPGLTDAQLHYSTVMPGFILEQGVTSNMTYNYDAPTLNTDFPNLDLFDPDFRTGVDTITMSFMVSGIDGEGRTVYRARQVLLQGEELMIPAQTRSHILFLNGFE